MMRFKGEKWDLFGDIISGELSNYIPRHGEPARDIRLNAAPRDDPSSPLLPAVMDNVDSVFAR